MRKFYILFYFIFFMGLEEICEFGKEKMIEDNREYLELSFKLQRCEAIADNLINYLSSPKRDKEDTILVSNEQINSEYLSNLAEAIEILDEALWNYRQENSIENFFSGEIYDSTILDKPERLLMYASYLKSRKNPKVLNINELKRIKKHPFRRNGFQLEIDERKYEKINEKIDDIQYNLMPQIIIFPFKTVYNSLKFVKEKVDNFFDKYKYQEDGKTPSELF